MKPRTSTKPAFDAARWSDLVDGTACPVCVSCAQSTTREPRWVATLDSGRVVLQNDAAFRGYCILYCRRHVTEIFELTAEERAQMIRDVARIARAVQEVCNPRKLNYAMLGNEVPHLHCHVIPRYPHDGYWGKAIWTRPAGELRSLPAADYDELRLRLRTALQGRARPAVARPPRPRRAAREQ